MRPSTTCYELLRGTMINLKDFIEDIIKYAPNPEKANINEIISFLVDNNWFGNKPVFSNQAVMLDDNQIKAFTTPLKSFLTDAKQSTVLLDKLDMNWPLTTIQLTRFFIEEDLPEDIRFYLADFLLYRLTKDIFLYTDDEVKLLLKQASMDMIKTHGEYLTFFMAWLRTITKTNYYSDYTMDKRYTMDIQNEAYDFSEYLELLYFLFNEDYINDNEMYKKAAGSKNYTDTWLYLSIHFICSLRYTDLTRVYHPNLPYPAIDVIHKVHDDSFTDNDARIVLLSITTRMSLLPFTPNKTDEANGIGSVKFVVPSSCEVHFGKLFALAEAHRLLDGTGDTPIIRKISTYEEITRYMGDEIGDLFLESDFRSRSATKSYLQSIYMLSDDILDEDNDGPSVKGYILAALARSHKGSYGEFASTTFEYLKDTKLSGLTPEFVAFELLERGVLSFVSSTLLKMITREKYLKLTVQNQTKLVKSLDLSPLEIESIITVVDKGKSQAEMVIKEVINSETDILTALHRIGSGQAFSKEHDCLCLLTSIEKLCPYTERRQCVGCKYEISTKSTFYLMISEYNRLSNLYSNASNELEKGKYKKLITQVIIPKIDEMLYCIKENYGKEVFSQYEELLKENT